MGKNWFTAKEILNFGVKSFELLEAIINGELTPHHEHTGHKIVDADILPRIQKSREDIELETRSEDARKAMITECSLSPARGSYRRLTEGEIKTQSQAQYEAQSKPRSTFDSISDLDAPPDCIPIRFSNMSIGMAESYIYRKGPVLGFLDRLGLLPAIPKTISSNSTMRNRGEKGGQKSQDEHTEKEVKANLSEFPKNNEEIFKHQTKEKRRKSEPTDTSAKIIVDAGRNKKESDHKIAWELKKKLSRSDYAIAADLGIVKIHLDPKRRYDAMRANAARLVKKGREEEAGKKR